MNICFIIINLQQRHREYQIQSFISLDRLIPLQSGHKRIVKGLQTIGLGWAGCGSGSG